MEHKQFIP